MPLDILNISVFCCCYQQSQIESSQNLIQESDLINYSENILSSQLKFTQVRFFTWRILKSSGNNTITTKLVDNHSIQ